MKDMQIRVLASHRCGWADSECMITITGNEKGIFVGDQEAEMSFGDGQLTFFVTSRVIRYLISDDRSGASVSIKEIFDKFQPFMRPKK